VSAAFRSGAVPPEVRAPQKFALLIGINHYLHEDRISPLSGSLNDVEDMRQILTTKFEFPPENVLTLKDSEATHAGIIAAIQNHLIAKAQAGDIIVFHYSGHGSQMRDVTGKQISGLDETIVPYDSRDPEGKIFDISGAELHNLLVQLSAKTKNLTFILDSCHSGTLVRGARVRSISADTRTPPALPPRGSSLSRGTTSVGDEKLPSFAFISAATSRESAFEHFADGKDHGALTYFLTRQLRSAGAGVTYRDIMDGVAGNVTANYPAQHPSLEGVEADQFVFGDGNSLSRAYAMASPSALDSHRVTLSVGQVQGATVGSLYDVYPPGSKKFASPEKAVARVQLVSVDALTSEASVVLGTKPLPASRAVEREHRYGRLQMRLLIDGMENSPTLQAINGILQTVPSIEIVDKASLCNMQLKETGRKIQTLAADSTTLSTPVSVDDPSAVNRVVGQVKAWAKWFNVLSIHTLHSDVELQFTLQGSQTRDPMARVGRPDMGVKEGEKVDVTIKNNSERDVYIAMLDLSSDGSISVVYPTEPGVKEILKPGMKLTRTLTTFVPKGRSIVTDILKVFASYKPIDLSPLTQEGIRSIGEDSADPLAGLLSEATSETRGVSAMPTKQSEPGSWTTLSRVLLVKRATQ